MVKDIIVTYRKKWNYFDLNKFDIIKNQYLTYVFLKW